MYLVYLSLVILSLTPYVLCSNDTSPVILHDMSSDLNFIVSCLFGLINTLLLGRLYYNSENDLNLKCSDCMEFSVSRLSSTEL